MSSQGANLPELAGLVSIPIITWAYLWYGRQSTWHKSKPKIVEFPEMLQSLQEVMKQGIMEVKPAQFDMQFMKPQWVTSSSYNMAADGQRHKEGTKFGKKVLIL
ncbi:hypothetical protein EI94DRAFT_1707347 [Lactarius quietus]|nr:hypothetical protein EI94DRAFT_1707347 [Lactarius quietus]